MHPDTKRTLSSVLIFICLLAGMLWIIWGLRSHGISSCKDRGGTPITRSWLSESAWDVSCINVPDR